MIARRVAAVADLKDGVDLGKRETGVLGLDDELETLTSIDVVVSIAGFRPSRLGNQSGTLVIADGRCRDSHRSCQFSNAHTA